MTEEKPDAELLAAFATEARQRCDVIATGLDTGTSDYETLRQEAHALHGTASTLGLRRLGELAGLMESDLSDAAKAGVPFEEIIEEVGDLEDLITAKLEDAEQPQASPAPKMPASS